MKPMKLALLLIVGTQLAGCGPNEYDIRRQGVIEASKEIDEHYAEFPKIRDSSLINPSSSAIQLTV